MKGRHLRDDDSPEPADNDWFAENEERDFKRAITRRHREAILNPDPGVERGSRIFAGVIVGAFCLAIAILIVGAALHIIGVL